MLKDPTKLSRGKGNRYICSICGFVTKNGNCHIIQSHLIHCRIRKIDSVALKGLTNIYWEIKEIQCAITTELPPVAPVPLRLYVILYYIICIIMVLWSSKMISDVLVNALTFPLLPASGEVFHFYRRHQNLKGNFL